MMDAIVQHGQAIALAAFNSGNFLPLAAIAKDAIADDANRRMVGLQAFCAAIVQFSRFIDGARAAGFRFTPEPPTADVLAYRAAISDADFWRDAALILDATKELVRAAPGIHAAQPLPPIKATEIERDEYHEAVRIVERYEGGKRAVASSEPIAVRVVAMPSRKTQTAVDRDESGAIVSAMQVESDF